jgi:hypothetical protein
MGHIGLADAIEQLRNELGKAQDAGANQQLQFQVDEVEVEFLVDIRQDVGASTKVQIGVLSLGADGGVAHGASHRLTFKLKVKDNAVGGEGVDLSRPVPRPWNG